MSNASTARSGETHSANVTRALRKTPRRRSEQIATAALGAQTPVARSVIHLILVALSLAAIVPFWIIISASLTDDTALTVSGYALWPREFSTVAYEFIFDRPERILVAYRNSILVSALGTGIAVLNMTMMAYAISRREFRLRRFYNVFIVIPMMFNGGLVPYYILVTQYLHLRNTFFVLLIPAMVGLYQMILLRAYFTNLPNELFEAARVDGAGEWRILFTLVFPLGRAALATIGLMMFMGYWNNWTTALYFIDDWQLYPLQYLLYAVMKDAEALALEPQLGGVPLPTQAARMAMAVVATGPAAIAFLFAQKYLVRGVTLGSLK